MNYQSCIFTMLATLATVFAETASGFPLVEATVSPETMPPSSLAVAFAELPEYTSTPFEIGGISFTGDGLILNSSFLNAPSGSPVFSTRSTPEDFVDVSFGLPVQAVGAYFNVQGNRLTANLELEIYDDAMLLATFALADLTSNTTSFFGAVSRSTPFNRAVFRNAASNRVSFLMDDLTFAVVPEPMSFVLICLGSLPLLRRI